MLLSIWNGLLVTPSTCVAVHVLIYMIDKDSQCYINTTITIIIISMSCANIGTVQNFPSLDLQIIILKLF